MRISYLSDIHADHHVPFTLNQLKWEKRTKGFIEELIQTDMGKREVLVIAGDLGHFNFQSKWILEIFSIHYEQVLIVGGNHDHYLISKNQSTKYKNNHYNRILELVSITESIPNVKYLEGFVEYTY